MQSRDSYVPGFDWVRLIGSTLVVLSHYGLFASVYTFHASAYRILSVLVPLFFMMSGFLRKRHFSKKLVFKQVIKYGSIYLAVVFCTVLYRSVAAWLDNGDFSFARISAHMLKGVLVSSRYSIQLWFIPALLFPLALNAFLNDRSRKIVIMVTAVLLVSIRILGEARLTDRIQEVVCTGHLIGRYVSGVELITMWRRFITGILFTTIGFDIDTWKIKPVWLLYAAVPFVVLEFLTGYLGAASIIMSILLFYLVKSIPGQFLYPYHMEISLFSCLMYFLHILERDIFNLITVNVPLNFFMVLFFNIAVTLVASYVIRSQRLIAKTLEA